MVVLHMLNSVYSTCAFLPESMAHDRLELIVVEECLMTTYNEVNDDPD